MALFNNFPWTNFHELNLDWIVQRVKEIEAAFPEGLVGIPKGGTGADNAADARSNLGIYASEIEMSPVDRRVISLVMEYLEDQIETVADNVNYRIFKTVQDLNLTPGSVNLASTWTAMSSGDILLCPPDELIPGTCPESYGTLLLIRTGGNSGSCLFLGANHQYRLNFVNNYPSGSWEQVYTDADTVPISNGGTGANNAADAIQNLGIDFSGTVLSVAGVGADPTGNVPKNDLREAIDEKFKIYKSVTEIGLPATGSTIAAVATALPTQSIIIFNSSEISNGPGYSGTIVMIKNVSLESIEFHSLADNTRNCRMGVSDGSPTGTWIPMADYQDIPLITVSSGINNLDHFTTAVNNVGSPYIRWELTNGDAWQIMFNINAHSIVMEHRVNGTWTTVKTWT